jgi:hypothetical protein
MVEYGIYECSKETSNYYDMLFMNGISQKGSNVRESCLRQSCFGLPENLIYSEFSSRCCANNSTRDKSEQMPF